MKKSIEAQAVLTNNFFAWLRSLNLAFTFLTRLPMPTLLKIADNDNQRSSLCFPFVGLCIGLVLASIALVPTAESNSALVAASVLLVWVFITGGLHIDGLADSADAWLGGLGNQQRSLEIMKDPRCGSGGLMAVGSLLIAKFAALQGIISASHSISQNASASNSLDITEIFFALTALPMIARAASLGIFNSCPYVSNEGSAKAFLQGVSHNILSVFIAAYLLLALILVSGLGVTTVLICSSAMFISWFLLRRLMMRRLGGCTGDTAGATVELVELTGLMSLSFLLNH